MNAGQYSYPILFVCLSYYTREWPRPRPLYSARGLFDGGQHLSQSALCTGIIGSEIARFDIFDFQKRV